MTTGLNNTDKLTGPRQAAALAVRRLWANSVNSSDADAADVAILAWLEAIAADDASVEAVARAIWDDREPETRVWEEKHPIMKDEWRRTARAVLRTLLERAKDPAQ